MIARAATSVNLDGVSEILKSPEASFLTVLPVKFLILNLAVLNPARSILVTLLSRVTPVRSV